MPKSFNSPSVSFPVNKQLSQDPELPLDETQGPKCTKTANFLK